MMYELVILALNAVAVLAGVYIGISLVFQDWKWIIQ